MWFIIIIILLLLLIIVVGNSDQQKTSPTQSYKEFSINKSSYKNEYSFLVAGGNFSEYLYAIYNIIKLHSIVTFIPEPDNKFDNNAIKVSCSDWEIGYVPSYDTDIVSKIMEGDYIAYIEKLSKDGYISISIKILYN